jgi:hypothetical protein
VAEPIGYPFGLLFGRGKIGDDFTNALLSQIISDDMLAVGPTLVLVDFYCNGTASDGFGPFAHWKLMSIDVSIAVI